MDRPAAKMRILNPEKIPNGQGSRLTEGLFTSELGTTSDETDSTSSLPTRTINLSDFQRRAIFNEDQQHPRAALPRRNAGIYLLPRAPDVTVTANVVEINVDDGTSTSVATEVAVSAAATVVAVADVGSLTVPGVSTETSAAGADASLLAITSSPTTSSPSSTALDGTVTTDLSLAASVLSEALNSTTTDSTVTVTATSTFEISYINGTIIATGTRSRTHTTSTRSESSSTDPATINAASETSSDPSGIGAGTYVASSTPTADSGYAATGSIDSSTTSPGAAASSSSTPNSGSSGGSPLTPVQQQVVGGVVGGVAGAAIVLLILLVILRWYRRQLKSRGELPEQIAQRSLPGGAAFNSTMSQRSSGVPFAALASSLKKWRPLSSQTTATNTTGFTASTVPESERGFQRIAGRKTTPAWGTVGDGFGGNYGAFETDAAAGPSDPLTSTQHGLSGASFYRDSGGFYIGKGPASPTFPPSPTTVTTGAKSGAVAAPSSTRDFAADNRDPSQISLPLSRPEGMAILRPGPARTPVTLSPASSIRLPIQHQPTLDDDAPPLPAPPGLAVPTGGDGIGRSLVSQDGSRVSWRSRNSGRSRFAENIS